MEYCVGVDVDADGWMMWMWMGGCGWVDEVG